ncbi:MAG: hypothetical protein N2689_02975 [Verrucomicrobiae bacterium]|nr:hypothetical protein [Verrucomicrobiae bacterium]
MNPTGRACLLCGLAVIAVNTALAGEIRHADVLYLDEAGMKPLVLKTRRPVSLTFSRDQSTILAPLRQGQVVSLLGYAERRYFVEARMVTGPMRGWVDADALEPLSLEQRAELDQRRERMQTNRAAIARHQVLIGMTPAEVIAAWGQPTEKSRTATAQGEEETWQFITYRSEPYTQTSWVGGFYVTETLYRKVAVGSRQVTFRNGLVVAVRENQGVQQRETAPVEVVVPVPMPVPGPPPPRPGDGGGKSKSGKSGKGAPAPGDPPAP